MKTFSMIYLIIGSLIAIPMAGIIWKDVREKQRVLFLTFVLGMLFLWPIFLLYCLGGSGLNDNEVDEM